MTQSLLFNGGVPFNVPPGCGPCRRTVTVTIRKFGRLYTFTMNDKIVVEDPYLNLVRAEAFALQQGEPFSGSTPPRTVRDFLIKSNLGV